MTAVIGAFKLISMDPGTMSAPAFTIFSVMADGSLISEFAANGKLSKRIAKTPNDVQVKVTTDKNGVTGFEVLDD